MRAVLITIYYRIAYMAWKFCAGYDSVICYKIYYNFILKCADLIEKDYYEKV